jgi:myo-inositol 2-dehydrogenase / D-chiro-inositol 1-dehydrogenase
MSQSSRTRRDFLKTTAGVTAASMAAPYFFTSVAGGAEEKGDKLIMAAIGVGGRGTDIGKQAARLTNMVACADVHLGNANNFSKEVGGKCQVYQDYRKVLDRKDVQAVTIGTPDHWHIKVALDALAAGKDVYCEKPLTLTIDESRIICKAVKASKRVFQVGTQQRSVFGRAFLEAVAIARSGRLGQKLKAKACVGTATTGGPFATAEPPKELDFSFWLGQAPKVPFSPERIGWNFRWWLDYSGGQVTDWGVHHTDIAMWALGGEKTGAIEVDGKGEFPLGRELMLEYLLGKKSVADLPNKYNVAERFDCNMRLANGNTINLNSVGNDLHITGEKGRLSVNRGGIRGKFVQNLKSSPAGREWLDAEVAKLYRSKRSSDDDLGHMINFVDCVKSRSLPISDVYSHCNSVNACHMANIAMLLNRKIKWDPRKQEFIGDEEANQLTRRKQREPYTFKV